MQTYDFRLPDPPVYKPFWRCVKCGHEEWLSTKSVGPSEVLLHTNEKQATKRGMCPMCTLKTLEAQFGRLG